MIDGTLFDKLEAMGRLLRNSDKPFGGIQVIDLPSYPRYPTKTSFS